MQRAERFLLEITERYQGVSPVLALAKLYATTRGEDAGGRIPQPPSCASVLRCAP